MKTEQGWASDLSEFRERVGLVFEDMYSRFGTSETDIEKVDKALVDVRPLSEDIEPIGSTTPER